MMMMFTVMPLGGARRLRRGRGGRGRVRCENAGLSDKAEDGSQKQNVFYHRLLLEHREEREVSKKIATLCQRESRLVDDRPDHLRQGERSVPRNER
jgi:hypothetical protein